MTTLLLLAVVAAGTAASLPAPRPATWLEAATVVQDGHLYEPYARVLETYVDDEGLVDYQGLKSRGHGDLETFMKAIAEVDPEQLPDDPARIAFWINAYNATVMWQVVESYPIKSVRSIGGLFGGGFFKHKYRIGGKERHLDNIEHDILRKRYKDARIHFALVCGAFGCPRLLQRPYLAEDLDTVLTAQTHEFLAQARGLRINESRNTLYLSKYFNWYGKDFKAQAGSVIDYILPYAPALTADYIRANRKSLRRKFMDYDWTLNDQANGPRSARAQ
ncbi:MAG: DUF547 domain-containing protein [Acidobacteriota bacterium]